MANRYWVGGSGTWDTSTARWSATNGGASGASVPTANDAVFVTSLSGSPTITVSGSRVCQSLTTTGATCTIAGTGSLSISGGMTLSATTTWTNTATLSFLEEGTITTNGVTITSPITINSGTGPGTTLADNLTTTKRLTFSSEILIFTDLTITALEFISSGTGTRRLEFGSTGQITVTGSGTVLNINGTSLQTLGSKTINVTNSTATATTVTLTTGFTSSNALNVNFTAGTYTLTATAAVFNSVNFTGFSGTLPNSTRTIYRDFTVSSTATYSGGASATTFAATSGTQVITSNGKTLDFPITKTGASTIQFADAFSQGTTRNFTLVGTLDLNSKTNTLGVLVVAGTPSIINGVANATSYTQSSGTQVIANPQTFTVSGTYTFTSGTLDLATNNQTLTVASFVSNNSNVRSIAFSTGGINVTGSGTPLNITGTNLSYTGTSNLNISNTTTTAVTATLSSFTETNALNLTINPTEVYSVAVNGVVKNLTFASGFAGSWSRTTSFTLYGSFTTSSTMSMIGGVSTITFAATSGTQVITSNGLTFPNIIQNGVGGTVAINGNLSIKDFSTIATYTLTNGTLDLTNGGAGNYTLFARVFTSNNSNIRSINFGSGSIVVDGTAGYFLVGTNFTYTGTPNLYISGTGTTTGQNFTLFTESNALNLFVDTGSYSLTLSSNSVLKNLNLTGFSGTFANSVGLTLYGNLTVPNVVTLTPGANAVTFAATSGTQTLTFNGASADFPITHNGVGGTLELNEPLTLGATRALSLLGGTFNANTENVNVGSVISTGTNVRTINMSSGAWTLSGIGTVWDCSTSTNLTLNKNSANITLSDTSASSRIFAGGGLTYNNLIIGGSLGSSLLTITGANTFGTISSTKTVAHTINFPASTTTTFSTFGVDGSSGNLVSIRSTTPGTQATLSQASGTVNGLYLDIQDSAATGGATWNALLTDGNVDSGNNTGWIFTGGSSSNFFLLF